jgi:hypothetical protein
VTRRLLWRLLASALALVLIAACSSSDGGSDGGGSDGGSRSTTTTTPLAAPATPSFAVGDLSAVQQCTLLSVAEAGALLRRPAELTDQATMGNAGTCTVQSTAPPLALVQWNVGVEVLSARAYTTRLEELQDELADRCGSTVTSTELPSEGVGDGARLLTCGTAVQVVASTGGHLLLLTVTRPPDATNGGSTNGGSTNGGSTNAGSTNGGSTNGDVVSAARLIVSRLPR